MITIQISSVAGCNNIKSIQYIQYLNTGSNPLGCSRSVLLVLAVSRGDNDTTIANVVPGTTEDASASRRNGAESLATLRVTKGNSCRDIKSVNTS
jgi:hypothetical protein